jgi:hypothetical protein
MKCESRKNISLQQSMIPNPPPLATMAQRFGSNL